MKKIILILFLFSIFLGYSQNNPPQSTQAQDWNSSRSDKTSKTSSLSNPDVNEKNNNKIDKKIHQLGMIIERRPSKGPNYYVSMPNKELTVFNKLPNQEKKLYFSGFVSKIIKKINPKEKIDKEDIMQATLAKWCGPCPLISARNDGGIIKIKKNDFVYKIYFSKGGRKDVEKVVIKDKTEGEPIPEGTNDPSLVADPNEGGFCYRQLDLNIDTTLEPIPEVEMEFCMDDSATQRVGNNKNDKVKDFFAKKRVANPDVNEKNNNKIDKKIHQLGMIIERRPSKGPNYYVSMPNKELTVFNKLPNQEKKLYFSGFVSKIIKKINPKEKIDKEDIMQATLAKWCGPCPLISARNDGGIIKIKKNDFVYKIYFSKGGRKDVEKVVIKDKTEGEPIPEGTNDPSLVADPNEGGFCYRQLDLNIDTTLEPIPEVEMEFCMDDSATQRVGNNKNDKVKDFFAKKRVANNSSPKRDINIGIAYGFSTPSSNFKDKTYAGNGRYFELSGAYYFSKLGLGFSIGQISNPTDGNLSDITGNLNFPVANNSENIKSTYIGIGPEYKIKLNKFGITFQIRAGTYAIKSFTIGADNIEDPDSAIPFLSLNSEKTTLGFVSSGVKFDYNINQSISFFISSNYLTTLSDKLLITESKIVDLNNNGVIDQEDFKIANGDIRYSITEKNSKPSSLNLGFGVSYHFGLLTKKNKVKEVIKKKEAVKNSIDPQNPPANGGNTQNSRKKGYDYYKSTSDNVKTTNITQNQTAKRNCIKSGGVFWENADGSYTCQTSIQKAQTTIKIPNQLANELATVKKLALTDKTQQGVIEITVAYPEKNKTVKVSIPAKKTQDADTILLHVLEVTQGNGDDNGKVRVKYVAKL